MYDSYIVKRTQIYLDETQDAQLGRRAKAAGVTKSTLIREAIGRYLDAGEDQAIRLARWRAALAEASRIAPYLPKGRRYVEDLRGADLARQRELETRRES
jgi:hypothetical protein